MIRASHSTPHPAPPSHRFVARLLPWLLAACLPLAAPAADWTLKVESDRHSDFSSMDDLRDDNAAGYHARYGHNIAYVQEEARLQRRDGAWTFSLLGRDSATLIGNRDAIDALRHSRGIGRDANDRHFDAQAHLRGFAGAGVEVQRDFALAPEWSGALMVQALALTRWRDREVSGTADFAGATSTYTFDLRSSEIHDRLDFPFQQPHGASGAGLLFGGDLGWSRGAWSLRAGVRDLGWLYWRGIPQQEFTLSTSTRAVDENGFVVIRPLLQGRNSQEGLTRSAPWRLQASAAWQVLHCALPSKSCRPRRAAAASKPRLGARGAARESW